VESAEGCIRSGIGVFVGFGVAVGIGVFVGFGVAVGIGVFVGFGVAVGIGVFVGFGVAVGIGVFVGFGVAVGIGVFVGFGVAVGSGVTVAVGSGVGVLVAVGNGVTVAVGSGVGVLVAVGNGVTVAVGSGVAVYSTSTVGGVSAVRAGSVPQAERLINNVHKNIKMLIFLVFIALTLSTKILFFIYLLNQPNLHQNLFNRLPHHERRIFLIVFVPFILQYSVTCGFPFSHNPFRALDRILYIIQRKLAQDSLKVLLFFVLLHALKVLAVSAVDGF